MRLRSIADWKAKDLKGKRVLVRVDFNVPIARGRIGEDWRIVAVLPTVRYLRDHGASVILATHVGRPNGRRVPSLSTRPIAAHLARLLRAPVRFCPESTGPRAERAAAALGMGDVLLLENLRFSSGEERATAAFGKDLATLADLYVDDAFATAHRPAASIVGVPRYLPSAAGLLLAEEVAVLERLRGAPKKPFVVLVGGVKVETKIGTIVALAKRADAVCLGGALAVPFLKAAGHAVGASPVRNADVALARRLLRRKNLVLPVDAVVATAKGAKARVVAADAIGRHDVVFDIGPDTVRAYAALVRRAKTVVWNGPLGLSEVPRFSHGTRAMALIVGVRSRGKAFGVVGGGETIAAVRRAGVAPWIDWVSTGGGAMLEFLEGKKLPGIAALPKVR